MFVVGRIMVISTRKRRCFGLPLFALTLLCLRLCSAVDRITFLTPIKDSESETLLCKNGTFRFGFFTPVNSTPRLRYVGIWYDKIPIQTVVWIANKETPINNTSGVISIYKDGNLAVTDGPNRLVWSTNVSVPVDPNAIWVQLMDSGNLMLQNDRNNNEILWESFKHPYDSFKPRMTPRIHQSEMEEGSARCGPYGICQTGQNPPCKCVKGFVPKNNTEWNGGNWRKGCVRKASLLCERQRNVSNGGGGGKADGFLKLQKMKVPISAERSEANEQVCPKVCLDNCSCTAYAYDRGIGCMLWSGSLVDMQSFFGSGIDLYIRVAHSELTQHSNLAIMIAASAIGIALIAAVCVLLVCWKSKNRPVADPEVEKSFSLELNDSVTIKSEGIPKFSLKDFEIKDFGIIKSEGIPKLSLKDLLISTDNFSIRNKLGQGGFGPVYKGKLPTGKKIAVKRLSRNSGQGQHEFMNEVVVVSRLQHRNLVKLLGFCVEGEERMLIYEYMSKKSLDAYLFDPSKPKIRDWTTRVHIMEGIGRGLLYLHRDSRLKIIHRDLKASNILLDDNLNPKISDFGTARIIRVNEYEANTGRVVGTFGYMSPEYAMGGLFSEKSDVFSLGVIFLEIISGRSNFSSHEEENSLNLLAYAWKLWNNGEAASLADPVLSNMYSEKGVEKCVHIGLLCVQEDANDRPNVSTVMWMLTTENTNLPEPKQPPFMARTGASEAICSDQRTPKVSVFLTAETGA